MSSRHARSDVEFYCASSRTKHALLAVPRGCCRAAAAPAREKLWQPGPYGLRWGCKGFASSCRFSAPPAVAAWI